MTQAVCVQKAPRRAEVVAGDTYWWCACGRSETQPFCDGSHAGTGLVPVEYRAERNGPVAFCGCRATRTPPLCDGSHKTLTDPGAPA